MKEDGTVQHHLPEAECNAGRAAEDKGINDSGAGSDFPQEEKKDQDQYAGNPDREAVAAHPAQKQFLSVRWFGHFYSAPSIFH